MLQYALMESARSNQPLHDHLSEQTKKSTTADEPELSSNKVEESKQGSFEELSWISEKDDEEVENSVIQKDSGEKLDDQQKLRPKSAKSFASLEKKSHEDLIDMGRRS